jgi:hypothetical protein
MSPAVVIWKSEYIYINLTVKPDHDALLRALTQTFVCLVNWQFLERFVYLLKTTSGRNAYLGWRWHDIHVNAMGDVVAQGLL